MNAMSDARSRPLRRRRRPTPRLRAALAVAAAAAGLLLTGCTSEWRAYDGPARPASELAVLRLPPDVVRGSVRLNDEPSPVAGVTRIVVEPGPHRIEWAYRHHNRFVAEKNVDFVAEAGEELRLAQTFVRTAGPLGPVGDATMLAVEVALLPISWLLPAGTEPPSGRYHCWVEGADGAVIAGDPPDLPAGYVEVMFVEVDADF
jgi:hypothetical protein